MSNKITDTELYKLGKKKFQVPKYGWYEVTALVAYVKVDGQNPEVITDKFLAKNAQDAFNKFSVRYGAELKGKGE